MLSIIIYCSMTNYTSLRTPNLGTKCLSEWRVLVSGVKQETALGEGKVVPVT
jgi:hypothetical protein